MFASSPRARFGSARKSTPASNSRRRSERFSRIARFRLDKWFVAIWSIANCKNGISSYELARAIGITQKSAWHMLHRIRLAMDVGGIDKIDGALRADETFIGPNPINMHAKRGRPPRSRRHVDWRQVRRRGSAAPQAARSASRVHVRHVKDATSKQLQDLRSRQRQTRLTRPH